MKKLTIEIDGRVFSEEESRQNIQDLIRELENQNEPFLLVLEPSSVKLRYDRYKLLVFNKQIQKLEQNNLRKILEIFKKVFQFAIYAPEYFLPDVRKKFKTQNSIFSFDSQSLQSKTQINDEFFREQYQTYQIQRDELRILVTFFDIREQFYNGIFFQVNDSNLNEQLHEQVKEFEESQVETIQIPLQSDMFEDIYITMLDEKLQDLDISLDEFINSPEYRKIQEDLKKSQEETAREIQEEEQYAEQEDQMKAIHFVFTFKIKKVLLEESESKETKE